MASKYFDYLNNKCHYTILGNGPVVVLIHGFAEDSSIWDEQVAHLANDYQLIIPDIPGSGASAYIKDMGLEEYADYIKAILDLENIDRCIMIGHSMGGYISLAFAENHRGMLIKLGVFHSSAYADDSAKIDTRRKAIEFIRSNGAEAFLKTSIPGLFYTEGNNQKTSNQINKLVEKGKAFTSDALIQYYEAMIVRPDRTALLKTFSQPILFIMGEHDKAVPFKQSLEQSHIPAHAYIHILRESAHMGMLEESVKVNGILANFLESR